MTKETMFHPILKQKFEYFTNYFETALKNSKRNIAQSIVLYGQDPVAQYYLAMEIARQLNCQKDHEADCGCINCNWIRNSQHPAILTISKNDNKPSDDTSSKVISIKQTHKVNNSLVNSSEYYRVFIFCDSEIGEANELEQKHLNEFSALNFKFPQENWKPRPITRDVLIEASANSLLKSIEEPPERTLFIFLTSDKEDIIETIISRSQSFYVPSYNEQSFDTVFVGAVFGDYPNIKKLDVLSIVSRLMSSMDEKGYKLDYVLDSIEMYFAQLVKSNLDNKILVQKIKKDILKIQHAKKQTESYIKPQLILEDLFFEFCTSL